MNLLNFIFPTVAIAQQSEKIKMTGFLRLKWDLRLRPRCACGMMDI
jgi:hypothetical protein